MPNALGLVLGVLLASGTMLGGWYVAFDAGMVRNDPASSLASVGGSFAYYDDEEDVVEPPPGEAPSGDPLWLSEDDDDVDANGNEVWSPEEEEIWNEDPSWWEDDGDLDPYDADEVYVDDPYYYDDADDIYYEDESDVVEEWDEYEVVQNQKPAQQANQPWYVKAFPGIGGMLQQLFPGQQTRPAPRPQPAPPRPTYPQPSCWLSAQPTLVASGGSSVLSWSSFNATRAALTGFGEVSVTGSRTVPNITSTRTFTLSVSGQGGNGSCYTRVTVQPPVSGLPSCIISVNPDVIERGDSANLAWGSQNASSATLSGVGAVPTQGGISVSPVQTTTYTLTVGGSSRRSNTCTVRLFVE